MTKVKECNACGQGFSEDNALIGVSVPSVKCKDGFHDGPIERIAVISTQGIKQLCFITANCV